MLISTPRQSYHLNAVVPLRSAFVADRPWNQDPIGEARTAPFSIALIHLGSFHTLHPRYTLLDQERRSYRVRVGYEGRDFVFIVTGPKFVSQQLPEDAIDRGGSDSIDFVRPLTGCKFVDAIKVCLHVINEWCAK